MWNYEKRLQYPVHITRTNAKAAQIIMSQYGGPDGEASASMRYLTQRYSMENRAVIGTLTDIGISVMIATTILTHIKCIILMHNTYKIEFFTDLDSDKTVIILPFYIAIFGFSCRLVLFFAKSSCSLVLFFYIFSLIFT